MFSEPTVSCYLNHLKRGRDQGKVRHWLAFLNNHRSDSRLRLLYGSDTDVSNTLLLLCHRTWPTTPSPFQLHGTSHFRVDPAAIKASSAASLPHRYVLFAYDAKFGHDVLAFLQVSGIAATRTSVRSPWQNGVAERWTGSVRREVFDHIILLNEPIFAGLVLSIWPTITKTAHTRIEQGHALRATATKVEGASQQKSLHAGKEKGHKNQREQLPLTG
jgi:hypothetical protein